MQPCSRSVLSLLNGRDTLSRILGKEVVTWREEPLGRFERRVSEFAGILDITVSGGVAHPADTPS